MSGNSWAMGVQTARCAAELGSMGTDECACRPSLREQQLDQQFCVIRDNRVHVPRCELLHLLDAIHCPEHEFPACAVNLFDRVFIRQIETRNYPFRWRFAPASKLMLGLAKNTKRNRWIEVVDGFENLRKKRRNHVSLVRRTVAQL